MTDHDTSIGENISLSGIDELIATEPQAAVQQLRERLAERLFDADAYRLLARALKALEHREGPSGELRVTVADFQLGQAAQALQRGDNDTAAAILLRRLRQKPDDADGLRMMAYIAGLERFEEEQEQLLRLALELRPDFPAAQFDLARALDEQKRHSESLELLDGLLERGAADTAFLFFRATELTRVARFEEAAHEFEKLARQSPDRPELWTGHGNVLKTLGRRDESIAAFRKALSLAPNMGVVWWSLSELKTYKFDESDVAQMQAALASAEISDVDRFHLHFALGKALEDRGDTAVAFENYAEGNRIKRAELPAEIPDFTAYVSAARKIFTRQFFDERKDVGIDARDPIFILGMTRAGSTLIEQILSSHPQVEGTMELPDLGHLSRRISPNLGDYPEALKQAGAEQLNAIGHAYIERTSSYRKTDRPFFLDKMPNNWLHIPLIQLALPNARIIDARRHPMACCFSNFKQHFAGGQVFSYDQRELGRYYADYVRFMSHIDEVLPGRVYRVFHECLVEDSEGEIRRLLDHLELPFDEACLRFYETERPVRTASSDQVRRPISRSGIDAWRVFEPWLGPLKEALGPVLNAYPDVPDFPSE